MFVCEEETMSGWMVAVEMLTQCQILCVFIGPVSMYEPGFLCGVLTGSLGDTVSTLKSLYDH